ncbi:unnamed protein product, partial [Nesidiocoris tenuis]
RCKSLIWGSATCNCSDCGMFRQLEVMLLRCSYSNSATLRLLRRFERRLCKTLRPSFYSNSVRYQLQTRADFVVDSSSSSAPTGGVGVRTK